MKKARLLSSSAWGLAVLLALGACTTPPQPSASAPTRYVCEGQPPVLVHYDNSDPQQPRALLSFEGKSFSMHSVRTASGARYATEQGRRPDMSLEWHTKGGEGLLMEAPLDHTRTADSLKVVARCKQQQ